jgi:transposase
MRSAHNNNAPIHVSKKSMAWFKDNAVELLEWPPYSPDLNPIENLWFPLKAGVYQINPDTEFTKGGTETVREVLMAAAEPSWSNIKQEVITACLKSMPRRLAAVRKEKGWYTGY